MSEPSASPSWGAEAIQQDDDVSATHAFAAALMAPAAEIEDADRRVRALVRAGHTQMELGDHAGARDTFSRAVSAADAAELAGQRAALLADIALALALASGRLPAAAFPF